MNQLDKISLLDEGGRYTCVVLEEDKVIYTSTEKGVQPLKVFYETIGTKKDLVVIDRVMGKGAVILADLVGAKTIITPVISESALEYAKLKQIDAYYNKIVGFIINRTKDGSCPIEAATKEVKDSQEGFIVIKETLKKLRG